MLPDMVSLASSLGLEEVKAVYLTSFSQFMDHETLYDCQEEVRQVFHKTESNGKKLGVAIKLPYVQGEDPALNQCHRDCFVCWRDLFIGSDGFARPCMSTPVKFLNIEESTTFDSLWNSQHYIDFRGAVNTPEMNQFCKKCYQSSHANWNLRSSFIQTGEIFSPEWGD